MTYTVSFSQIFGQEFSRSPEPEQNAVASFIATFQAVGLADQTKYPGRISPSWANIPQDHPNAIHAKKYDLWHYHVGLPDYTGVATWDKVSDWLLHFQWRKTATHVHLVDLYQHHRHDGSFYLPAEKRLGDLPLDAFPPMRHG